MSTDRTNLYETLGVPEDSSSDLISAAYKALAKAFHPDVFKGDRSFAERRLKDINNAFSILNNPEARRAYDAELRASREYPNDTQNTPDQKPDDSWRRACDFFPELKKIENDLRNLGPDLVEVFRRAVLQMKAFSDAESIKDKLTEDFAQKRFGPDKITQMVGLRALELGHRSFALKINQACSLLGGEHRDRILQRLANENPDEAAKIYPLCGLHTFIPKNNYDLEPGLYVSDRGIGFRVLPNMTVNVFEEFGGPLLNYKHFKSVAEMLKYYSLPAHSIKRRDL